MVLNYDFNDYVMDYDCDFDSNDFGTDYDLITMISG